MNLFPFRPDESKPKQTYLKVLAVVMFDDSSTKRDTDIDKQEKKVFSQKPTKKKRAKFAKKIAKKLKEEFWTEGISFYFDGVGFVNKTNQEESRRIKPDQVVQEIGERLEKV